MSLRHTDEGSIGLAFGGKKIKCLSVGVHIGGQCLVQQDIHITACSPHTRDGERQQPRVRLHCVTNFGVSSSILILAQKKVPVVPCNFGGQWIYGARLFKCVSRACYISIGLVGRGQVHPKDCGKRVIPNGPLVVGEHLHRVGVCEVELPVAAKKVPGRRVSGLQRNSTLNPLDASRMNIDGQPARVWQLGRRAMRRSPARAPELRGALGFPGVMAAQGRNFL